MKPGILYVDRAVGSRELLPTLKRRFALPAEIGQLRSADFAFMGSGPTGPVRVGFERKRLRDLASSLISKRLEGHQIPNLYEDYDFVWLIVEGIWRPGEDNAIEVRKGKRWVVSPIPLSHTQLDHWLTRLEVVLGGRIKLWRTVTPIETCKFVADKYTWFSKKWEKHKIEEIIKTKVLDSRMIFRPTPIQRMASELANGIGSVKARQLGRFFESKLEMVTASEALFRKAGLSKRDASKVYEELRRKYR